MNICVLTHTYPRFPGDPTAPFMKDFCNGLVEQKQKVVLLTPYDKLFSLRNDKTSNFKVKLYRYVFPNRFHVLGYSKTLIGDQRIRIRALLLAPFMLVASFISLMCLVHEEKIQVISAHWIIPNGFIAALVSKITGVPLVITIPGSDVYLAKRNYLFKLITKFASSQAKIIASNSVRYLEELSDIEISKEKLIEIPYGVDMSRYRELRRDGELMRKQLNFNSSDQIILAVGRLVEKKGFSYLINAMREVMQRNKRAKLVIVGDGTEKEALRKLAKEIGVDNKVFFVGKINHTDLPKYYALANIYVAPSIKDPHGNLESHTVALFEAIASGLPIVATKLAVNSKYVINGKNGYRVNDKDSDSLAFAIIKLLNSNSLDDMRKQSKDIAVKYLSYQYCTNEYIKIFNQIIRA